MVFRQKSTMFQILIFFDILSVVTAIWFTVVFVQEEDGWFLYEASILWILCIAFVIITFSDMWHKIRLDENGICCFGQKEVFWRLSWDEVAHVNRIRHNRFLSVQIIPKVPPVIDLQSPKPRPDFIIEYGVHVRNVFRLYCPLPITKL